MRAMNAPVYVVLALCGLAAVWCVSRTLIRGRRRLRRLLERRREMDAAARHRLKGLTG